MRAVLSYSLFGKDTPYARFLPAVVRANLALFPAEEGWVMRIHHDEHLDALPYGPVLRKLEAKGTIELRRMRVSTELPTPLCVAMMWRIAPLFDKSVDVVFCRDLDALPTPRDRAACDEFLASSAQTHVIHDQPVHDGMMGGLCGFKSAVRTTLDNLGGFDGFLCAGEYVTRKKLSEFDWNKKGADQDVLNQYIVPMFQILVHHYPGRKNRGGFAHPSFNVEWKQTPQVGPQGGPPSMRFLLERQLQAEALAPYMGCDGFDVEKAVEFYDELPEPLVLDDVDDAEQEAGWASL
jgi:hypothetical protein